jgi:hypothetical protein
MRPPREDTEPWYKQFWPWFLIALPLSVVIAAIVTINIAIESDDGLVSDDYYKEGLAIHKDADSAAKAQQLGIAGSLDYDVETGAITLVLDQPLLGDVAALALQVTHPTRPNQDQSIELTPLDGRQFVGRVQMLGQANWKLQLRPADKTWRIEGRLPVPGSAQSRLD